MKKMVYWLVGTFAVMGVLALLLHGLAQTIVGPTIDVADRPYKLSITENASVGYKIGATILRPLLEARIDSYIKEQGLEEYFENLKANMPQKSNFSVNEMERGTGPGAVCGQLVTATVISMPKLPPGNVRKNTSEISKLLAQSTTTELFRIGTHAIKELNSALLGLRRGGGRVILIHGGENAGSVFVNLVSIESPEPTEDVMERFMVFDKVNPDGKGTSAVARCGEKVSVMYNVRDHRGAVLAKEQTADFVIGERTVPVALDLAAVDLQSNIKRSVIVPPELLDGFEDLDKNSIKILDLWMNPSTHSAGPKTSG